MIQKSPENKSCTALIWLMLPYQITIAVFVCLFTIYNQNSVALVEGEAISVVLVVLAAIIESPSEVYYLKSITSNDMSARMIAEGGSLFCKQILTYFLLRADFGLLSYSASWLIQSILLNLFYYWFQKKSTSKSVDESGDITESQKVLVREFSKSCVLKFFLSEGEKFVMIYMALLETSAEYSLVAGLVGLICRFIF